MDYYICTVPEGVAFRSSPRLQDRSESLRGPTIGDQIKAEPLGSQWLKLHLSSWGALPSVNLTLFLPLYQYASERPWFRLAELLYPAVVGVASWACDHTDAYYRTSTLRPVSQIPSLPDLSPYLRHPLRLHGSQDLLHVPELGVVGPADGTFLARQW